MEVYIGPPQANPDAFLRREQVLAAFAHEGIAVAKAEEKPATGHLRAWWILAFESAELTLQFQETDNGLVLATLEQSMFDASNMPDRVCRALESLGWEVDQENIG